MGFDDLAKLPLKDYAPFIHYVRFPSFKNLEPGTRIDFHNPITVLVGPNGTNKSSILRSLQGCPDNNNIGNFWFNTDLDPIKDGTANRYIHGYQLPSGDFAEVIKARVNRSDRNPDYFETSAPRLRDGMQKMPSMDETPAKDRKYRVSTRWKSIEKDVLYFDFRQEIPAYDIHFYFNWRGRSSGLNEKKKLVRRRAHHVRQALQNLESSHQLYKKDRILEPAVSLSSDEVKAVSHVLGRTYSQIRIVKHDLFDVEGYTARMETSHLAYSEAFAGSGEFAAIMMVRGLFQAPEKSLILMDEPETSLHPGAQQSLMEVIYKQVLAKKLQVVITTHSPAIVSDLPPSSIKILGVNESTGRIGILSQTALAAEAFHRIGATFSPKSIFVEDDLAAEIILRASRLIGFDFLRTINIKIVPGGAGSISARLIPVLPHSSPDSIVLLDGDRRPLQLLRDPALVPDGELEDELKKVAVPANHFRNGGNDKGLSKVYQDQRTLLQWVYERLHYLPGSRPEQLLMELEGTPVLEAKAAKSYWKKRAFSELGLTPGETVTSAQILDSQRRFLAGIDQKNTLMKNICDLLQKLMTG